MKGLELIEKYPLAGKVVKDWFLKEMINSFKDESVPSEFKDFMLEQGVDDDKIGTLIDVNPRMLLDVFDENGLYVHIVPIHSVIEPHVPKMKFLIGIDTLESLDDTPSTPYSTRKEAELFAVEAAFEMLENKLTPKELIDETDNE
jgi:hypothetical protein